MSKIKEKALSDKVFGYILLIPAMAAFLAVIFYPFLNSMFMSFTNRSMLKQDYDFIFLENFKKIIDDPNFLEVIKNSVIFVIGTVGLSFILGLIWALVLNEKFRGAEFLRGLTLIDWIIPSTAIGFLWMWIFNANYGVLNGALRAAGIIEKNINWLGKTDTAMLVVIIARTWQLLPWNMAFLTGGLQSVSIEQTEAAKIDGASNIQIFIHVILPSIKPVMGLVLLLGTISNLQHFDLIWVMTEGGPARATTTLALEVYRNAFKSWKIGLSASVGVIWMLLISIFTFFYIKSNMKDVD
ncbi:MAG: carbohydrate ABC transporter permease [Flexilinea sp.]